MGTKLTLKQLASQLEHWYQRYTESPYFQQYRSLEIGLSHKASDIGYLEKGDLFWIAVWGGDEERHQLGTLIDINNTSDDVIANTRDAIQQLNNPANALRSLLRINYCGVSYGSKTLRCIRPQEYAAFDYHVRRGCLHAALGEIDAAIADHTKALEVDPSNVTAYNNRAVAYGDKGDWAKSISDLDCAIRVDPEYIEGYQLRGFAKYQIGRYREAIVDLTKAIELDKRQSYEPLAHRNGHELPPDFGAVLLSQLPGYGYLRAPGDITPMCLFWRSKAHRCLGKRLLAREDEKKFERLTKTQVKRSFRDRLLDWLAELTGTR